MSNPGLPEDVKRKAAALVREHGTVGAAARATGMSPSTLKNQYSKDVAAGYHLSEGAQRATNNAGLSGIEVGGGWIHNYDDEGKKIGTTRWTAPKESAEDFLERLRTAFDGVTPAQPVAAPANVMSDLLTVYPLFDVHLGMLAWGDETRAGSYDLRIAADDMRYAFAKVSAITPASKSAVLLLGGDFFHADTDEGVTKRSKHSLDTDGRIFKVMDTGIDLIADTIERLLEKHEDVTVRVLRGNHDEDSHRVLTFSLDQRYRLEPRVTVEKIPHDLFMKQWGRCLIAAHHGDTAKAERLTLYLSDVCPFWSETRHRFMFTGHIHHDLAKDVGPLRWESLRAFCPPDAYAAGMKYATRRALQALTFHNVDGLVLRAIDPIERTSVDT